MRRLDDADALTEHSQPRGDERRRCDCRRPSGSPESTRRFLRSARMTTPSPASIASDGGELGRQPAGDRTPRRRAHSRDRDRTGRCRSLSQLPRRPGRVCSPQTRRPTVGYDCRSRRPSLRTRLLSRDDRGSADRWARLRRQSLPGRGCADRRGVPGDGPRPPARTRGIDRTDASGGASSPTSTIRRRWPISWLRTGPTSELEDRPACDSTPATRCAAAEARAVSRAWHCVTSSTPDLGSSWSAAVPGTGKSTIADGLARRIGAMWLRADELRKDLAGLGHDDHAFAAPGEGIYSDEMTTPVYTRRWRTSRQDCYWPMARVSCSTQRSSPPSTGAVDARPLPPTGSPRSMSCAVRHRRRSPRSGSPAAMSMVHNPSGRFPRNRRLHRRATSTPWPEARSHRHQPAARRQPAGGGRFGGLGRPSNTSHQPERFFLDVPAVQTPHRHLAAPRGLGPGRAPTSAEPGHIPCQVQNVSR